MKLSELLTESKKKKSVGKSAAAAVYRRDYLKTRNKDYRQYDPEEYKHDKTKKD